MVNDFIILRNFPTKCMDYVLNEYIACLTNNLSDCHWYKFKEYIYSLLNYQP